MGKKGGEKGKEREWGGITKKGRRDKEEAKQGGGGKYEGAMERVGGEQRRALILPSVIGLVTYKPKRGERKQ